MEHTLAIHGDPVGKQSNRVVTDRNGHSKSYIPEKSREYMTEIKWLFKNKYRCHKLLAGSISLEIKAYIKIPTRFHGEYVTKEKKRLMLLNEIKPTNTPDCDNISKLICDGLTDICWVDDAQVTDLTVTKRFDPDPRVELTIRETT